MMKDIKSYISEVLNINEIEQVNESFNCSWLQMLQKTFKKINDDYTQAMKECEANGDWCKPHMSSYKSFKSMLDTISMQSGVSGIRWDKITDDDFAEYKPKQGVFKAFLTDIWKGTKKGIIVGVDADDYVCCIFCNGVLFKLPTWKGSYGFDKSGWKVHKGDTRDYIRQYCVRCGCLEFDVNNDPKKLLIKDDDPDSKNSREERKTGVVKNTPDYYRDLARANRERWKKTIRANKMNNKDFTKTETRITKILYDFADLDPFEFMENESNFYVYNEALKMINNGSTYSSSSIIGLYFKVRNSFKSAKAGDAYAERELQQYEQMLEQKLSDCETMMNRLREMNG